MDILPRHEFYDSEDEEQDSPSSSTAFSVHRHEDFKDTENYSLLIGVGSEASFFLRSYLELGLQPVLTITCSEPGLVAKHEGSIVTEVYIVEKKAGAGRRCLVCLHPGPVLPQYCNTWCEQLMQALPGVAGVVVLQFLSEHQYLCPVSQPAPLVRALHTSHWRCPPLASPLEPPNTIDRESAAVLSHCEVSRALPACLVAVYTSDVEMEMEELCCAVEKVLQSDLLLNTLIVRNTTQVSHTLKQSLLKQNTNSSSLYT